MSAIWGNIIVIAVLIAVVALVVRSLWKSHGPAEAVTATAGTAAAVTKTSNLTRHGEEAWAAGICSCLLPLGRSISCEFTGT